jgi:LPS export ABC transporter protein LptC
MEGDSADQTAFGIEHNISNEGLRRVRIEADTRDYYDAQQSVELRQLTVIFFSTEGVESSRITADWGTYDYRTGDMVARSNVVGTTPDGRRLTSSKLEYDQVSDRLATDEPFVFDSADEHLEGSGFSADRDFRNVRVTNPREGRVRN